MNRIDFSPLYRSTVGFDRLATILDTALQHNHTNGYPPYNIESTKENEYSITLAVAGFDKSELDLQTEKGVLTIRGEKKAQDKQNRNYLYQGIATRTFERKFELADHVEVVDADLSNGMLTIQLVKEIPEAMKPKRIAIGDDNSGTYGTSRIVDTATPTTVLTTNSWQQKSPAVGRALSPHLNHFFTKLVLA